MLSRDLARALAISLAIGMAPSIAFADGGYTSQPLIATGKTIMGEPIIYPTTGPALITARTSTFAPGATTILHQHGVPLFTYILEGELTIDYGSSGVKTYKKGEAYVEAMHVTHMGKNLGTVPVVILAVYIGAEGAENTIPVQ
ncbi:MAG: cupin domain-containing protein [Azospirillaceae bacterium]|nr:cupin domain-containing protein [Azospirillaceae bacterium]